MTKFFFDIYIIAASGQDRRVWRFAIAAKNIGGTVTLLGNSVSLNGVGDASLLNSSVNFHASNNLTMDFKGINGMQIS